jgi:DNA-binding CsgD family transcriptional regulator
MSNVQNNTNSTRIYLGLNCHQHLSNQSQLSNSGTEQANPEQVKAQIKEAESKNNIGNVPSTERQVTIPNSECILCKTSPSEISQKYELSTSKKIINKLQEIFAQLGAGLALTGATLGFILYIALMVFSLATGVVATTTTGITLAMCLPIGTMVAFGLVGMIFSCTANYLEDLDERNHLQHWQNLQANSFAYSMLKFMESLAEKDKELKELLSDGMTEQGLKNILDINNITKQRYLVIKQKNHLCDQLNEINEIQNNFKSLEAITEEERDTLKRIMQDKLYKEMQDKIKGSEQQKVRAKNDIIIAQQQILVAQNDLNIAVSELLISLIDNICANFAENKDDQEKIKASFLNSCKNNQDDFKLTLTNIINTCLKIETNRRNFKVNPKIITSIDDAVNNTISKLYGISNDTVHITDANTAENTTS